MCREVFPGVRDWSGHPPKGLGRVGRNFGRFNIGREVLRRVQVGSEDPPEVRVEGPSRRSWMGRRTLLEVRDGSGNPQRSGTGRGTLREVRDGSGVHREIRNELGTHMAVRDGSGDPQGDLGWIGGPSRRSETGGKVLRKVRDESGDHPEGLGWVGGPTLRSRMGWGTLLEV